MALCRWNHPLFLLFGIFAVLTTAAVTGIIIFIATILQNQLSIASATFSTITTVTLLLLLPKFYGPGIHLFNVIVASPVIPSLILSLILFTKMQWNAELPSPHAPLLLFRLRLTCPLWVLSGTSQCLVHVWHAHLTRNSCQCPSACDRHRHLISSHPFHPVPKTTDSSKQEHRLDFLSAKSRNKSEHTLLPNPMSSPLFLSSATTKPYRRYPLSAVSPPQSLISTSSKRPIWINDREDDLCTLDSSFADIPIQSYRPSTSCSQSYPPSSNQSLRSYNPASSESHIHPLFRSDSVEPPPPTTPDTVIVASPFGGGVIPRSAWPRAPQR